MEDVCAHAAWVELIEGVLMGEGVHGRVESKEEGVAVVTQM